MTKFKNLIFIVLAACLLCLPSMAYAQTTRLREADLSAYEVSYDTDPETGVMIVKNTHTPETKDFEVGVRWDDDSNRDGLRPGEVTLQLYNGEQMIDQKTVTVTSSDQLSDALQTWQSQINADKYQNHGEEIPYSIKVSSETPDGYTYEYDNSDPLFVTAKHDIDTIEKKFNVIFDDDNNRDGDRPDTVTVQLYQNDEPYGDPVVLPCDPEGICKFSDDDLPKNVDGEPAKYSIQVVVPEEGYTPTTDPETGDITLHKNDYLKKNITVKKVWDDNLDQDGLRPDSICIILSGNGDEYKYTLSGSKDVEEWTYTFNNVYVNHDGGIPIDYSVVENGTVCGD